MPRYPLSTATRPDAGPRIEVPRPRRAADQLAELPVEVSGAPPEPRAAAVPAPAAPVDPHRAPQPSGPSADRLPRVKAVRLTKVAAVAATALLGLWSNGLAAHPNGGPQPAPQRLTRPNPGPPAPLTLPPSHNTTAPTVQPPPALANPANAPAHPVATPTRPAPAPDKTVLGVPVPKPAPGTVSPVRPDTGPTTGPLAALAVRFVVPTGPVGRPGIIASAVTASTPPAVTAPPAAPAARVSAPAIRPIPPVRPSTGSIALSAAMSERGTPYVWGGTSPHGFDCSGLTLWSFRRAGVKLPRTSRAQSTVGTAVSRADLRPGDLVFFYSPVSHVAIYIGNGQVVHAPEPGQSVKISPLARMPFHNARRL
jgi:cell wall-associated NlpC family hydrolase